MGLFTKNVWLNFLLGFLGFYFSFQVVDKVLEEYGIRMVTFANLSITYYWLVYFAIALLFSCILAIIFCKPASPMATALSVFCGFVAVRYYELYRLVLNLDKSLHTEGLRAFRYLLPHLVAVLGFFVVFYLILFFNKLTNHSEG